MDNGGVIVVGGKNKGDKGNGKNNKQISKRHLYEVQSFFVFVFNILFMYF